MCVSVTVCYAQRYTSALPAVPYKGLHNRWMARSGTQHAGFLRYAYTGQSTVMNSQKRRKFRWHAGTPSVLLFGGKLATSDWFDRGPDVLSSQLSSVHHYFDKSGNGSCRTAPSYSEWIRKTSHLVVSWTLFSSFFRGLRDCWSWKWGQECSR